MEQTLSHYFGYKSFRPGQKEIIERVLNPSYVRGVTHRWG